MRLTAGELAAILQGSTADVDGGAMVLGVETDSRRVKAGDAFFALKGDFFDGHEFVREAESRGAVLSVVARANPVSEGARIVVDDPFKSIAVLSGWLRDVFSPTVVGITGSTGKTSVKDLLAAICSTRLNVVASEKSYNNELGVPLTLLRIKMDTDVALVEMGARGRGHIRYLCDLARPHVGVLTNVGVTHYEQFGSPEAIAEAKSELVQALPPGGIAVLNADDERVLAMRRQLPAEVESVTYGARDDAWIRFEGVRLDRLGRPTFRIVRGAQSCWVTLPVSGAHQVSNALAATAAALNLGLSLEECRVGLETTSLSPWRMQVRDVEGVLIVNDAYNSNPTSLEAALHTCSEMAGEGRLIAVLGYMAELGALSAREHRRAGSLAASVASRLVVVGKRTEALADGAREAGLEEVFVVDDAREAAGLIGGVGPGDVVLVKGSRVAALERVAADLESELSS